MNAKALLVPIAAFAVTATGVQAFNSQVLENAGLTEEQISAFETAHELKKDGDRDAARDTLIEAGIDVETMKTVRRAMHEYRHEMKAEIRAAVEADDFDAFKDAADGSPITDIVTTEEDFELFKQAHEFREAGNKAEAREIMEELGFEKPLHKHRGQKHHSDDYPQ